MTKEVRNEVEVKGAKGIRDDAVRGRPVQWPKALLLSVVF